MKSGMLIDVCLSEGDTAHKFLHLLVISHHSSAQLRWCQSLPIIAECLTFGYRHIFLYLSFFIYQAKKMYSNAKFDVFDQHEK